jgi:protocatechuate 3,4-dioxygenase beta subunit
MLGSMPPRHALIRITDHRPSAARAAPPRVAGLSRRDLLRGLGLAVFTAPVVKLAAGCGSSDVPAVDGNLGPDGITPDGLSADGWARGGTAAMTDLASYPDPFTEAPTSCLVLATATLGPCTTESDLDRQDVSEGWDGLPVRLMFKLVDSGCQPVAGATVKIWHTNLEGVYSGATPNPGMCSGNDAEAISADFFRGVQVSDAAGVVAFSTCFPGWYNGRAIHIHLQVKQGDASTIVSQVFFPEDVTQGIFASHVDYQGFGQPDTTFADDNVVATMTGGDFTRHVLAVARMSDGAMLASKVITIE